MGSKNIKSELSTDRNQNQELHWKKEKDYLLQAGILEILAGGVVFVRSSDGEIVYANPGFENMFKYEPGELIGKHVSVVNAPTDINPEEVALNIITALEVEGKWKGEIKGRRKDGTEFWIHGTISEFEHSEFGEIWVAMHEDVTERIAIEDQLQKSEAKLKQAQQIAGLGYWDWNIKSNEVFWSDQMYRIWGVNQAEGATFSTFESGLHPDDKDEVLKLAENTVKGIGSFNHEYRVVRPDGTVRVVHSRGEVIKSKDDNPVRMLWTVNDITERIQAEAGLRLHSEVINNMVESVNLVRAEDGVIVYTNPATEKIYGYKPGELLGKTVDILNAPTDKSPQETTEEITAILKKHEYWKGEVHAIKKDGTTFWASYTVSTFEHSEFGLVWLGISHDITERKVLEDQLRQSQKLESVGQLAGGVAHEFNNALQVMMGFNEFALQKTSEDDPRHKDLTTVKNCIERTVGLVAQLLSFARRKDLQPKLHNLNDLVEKSRRMLQSTIGAKCQIRTRSENELRDCNVDEGSFEQILLNLCINAKDAILIGGEIVIETRNSVLNEAFCRKNPWANVGEYVRVSVSDNGAGMSEEVMDHIFEPFYTTKGPQEGSGLGLSMVHGLMQQHMGFVQATSKVGEGTRIDLYFPVAKTQRVEAAVGQGEYKGTILVVEDDRGVQALAQRLLGDAGYRVIIASDGVEAVELFENYADKIDIVVLDVIMPRMGGIEAYWKMKGIKPDFQAIFHSALALEKSTEEFIRNEELNFLGKPYAPKVLLEAVTTCLE